MIGTGELIVILCLILFLFGGKKLPEFARNLGKGIREFRNACEGKTEDAEDEKSIKQAQHIDVEVKKEKND